MRRRKRRKTKLAAKASDKAATTVTRAALGHDKIVYVGRANKRIRYAWGQSRIVYIGRTEVGANRVAVSATSKAKELLGEHGLKVLEFFPVTPEGRQRIKSWHFLEADLLFGFRQTFGALPRCNKRLEAKAFSGRFSQTKLKRIITRYS